MRPARPIILAVLSLNACVFNFGDVSGTETETQVREVEPFDSIALEGAVDVDAKVGAALGVEVEASPKVLGDIETVVEDGILHVRLKGGLHVNPGRMLVRVTAPSLKGVQLTGSGDAHVEGLDEDSFSIAVTGSGDVEAGGEAEVVTIAVTGSGDVGARGLETETATVDVRGSGDVTVTASGTASGSIAGSGDVTVLGGASCSIAVTGSGDVNC